MKKYELMYILMPTLSDEELEKENEKHQKQKHIFFAHKQTSQIDIYLNSNLIHPNVLSHSQGNTFSTILYIYSQVLVAVSLQAKYNELF